MNEYVIMFYLFMALVAVTGVIKIIGLFKRVEIEKKRLLYGKLLKEARLTRAKYIKNLSVNKLYFLK